MWPKTLKYLWLIWNSFSGTGTFFLEVGASLSLKLATKRSFRGKKTWKFRFLGGFCKSKTEECDHKNWIFSDEFEMLMPGSNTHFLEVSVHVSLKVATKGSFRGENVWKFSVLKAFFLKQKRRSAIEKNEVSLINLTFLYLLQLYIFWKLVHVFDWK